MQLGWKKMPTLTYATWHSVSCVIMFLKVDHINCKHALMPSGKGTVKIIEQLEVMIAGQGPKQTRKSKRKAMRVKVNSKMCSYTGWKSILVKGQCGAEIKLTSSHPGAQTSWEVLHSKTGTFHVLLPNSTAWLKFMDYATCVAKHIVPQWFLGALGAWEIDLIK